MLFFPEESESEREDQAEQNTGGDREIESKTSATEENIARQFPETRDLVKKSRKDPHADKDQTEKDQGLREIAHVFPPQDRAPA